MGGRNITKKNRDELKDKLEEVAAFLNTCEANANQQHALANIYEAEQSLKGRRYGLLYEEHRERIDDILDASIPVLVEDEELQLRHGGEQNFLIEGDNLVSLDLLCRTHAGRIDLIYIDPPYNTGAKKERFRYDDDLVDKNDLFRHSKWLTFMERRLRLARRLLSSKGAIFISINDIEQAPLKMLCEDIFGVDCFKGCICWHKTYSPRNDSKGIPAECEYIYVYSKLSSWIPKKLERTAEMNARYDTPDDDSRPWSSGDAAAPGAATHHGMVYAIQHPITGELLYPANGRCWTLGQTNMFEIMQQWADYELRVIDDSAKRAQICGCGKDEIESDIPSIMLKAANERTYQNAMARYKQGKWPALYFTSKGKGGIRLKRYLEETEGKLPTNFWPYSEVGHTDEAKKELKRIFDGVAPFETPKPTRLIKRIIEIASDDDSIVLDFFAGSATLADAVLQYNHEYGGHRRFIIATNNEENICREVAYERVRRLTEGYSFTGKQTKIVFDEKIQTRHAKKPETFVKLAEKAEASREEAASKHGAAKVKVADGHIQVEVEDEYRGEVPPLPGSLKYLRVDFIPFDEDRTYEIADEVMTHVRELVELENGIDFATSKTAKIALNDEELDDLVADFPPDCTTVYVGNDVLLTEEAERLFSARLVSVNVIPDYYYRELSD